MIPSSPSSNNGFCIVSILASHHHIKSVRHQRSQIYHHLVAPTFPIFTFSSIFHHLWKLLFLHYLIWYFSQAYPDTNCHYDGVAVEEIRSQGKVKFTAFSLQLNLWKRWKLFVCSLNLDWLCRYIFWGCAFLDSGLIFIFYF